MVRVDTAERVRRQGMGDMRFHTGRTGRLLLGTLAAALAFLSTITAGSAQTPDAEGGLPEGAPTAIVTLGDSYISGEAGRWQGNWPTFEGNRGGTDRAAYRRGWFWRRDPGRVYGDTAGGCHRSDVAQVLNNDIAVDAKINLACSGAATQNIHRASNGGVSHRGEAPQADQLAEVAATHDIEMIVLSIGGNDLGFADIILDCALRYTFSPSWSKNTCNGPQQGRIDGSMEPAMAGVAKSIDEIRAVMDEAGQPADSYRLVLQSYPSPVPRGDDFRYRESGISRLLTGGCPFWDVDATWARDSLVHQIADGLQTVAADRGVEFLDLRNQLDGREVCSVDTRHGTGTNAEWARFIVTGITQGTLQESMHPNAFGQEATGTCLDLLFAGGPGSYHCDNVPGSGPSTMTLSPN